MEQFNIDLTNMGDYRLMPQLVERMNEQIRIEGEKFICERLMDLQIDKDILFNQMQEIRRLNGILQEIKDKQEQGLLIELPCKVGDKLYQIKNDELYELMLIGLVCGEANKEWLLELAVQIGLEWHKIIRTKERIGTTIFLTRSEAEEALAKMGGK